MGSRQRVPYMQSPDATAVNSWPAVWYLRISPSLSPPPFFPFRDLLRLLLFLCCTILPRFCRHRFTNATYNPDDGKRCSRYPDTRRLI